MNQKTTLNIVTILLIHKTERYESRTRQTLLISSLLLASSSIQYCIRLLLLFVCLFNVYFLLVGG
jgi:hypothetical protein